MNSDSGTFKPVRPQEKRPILSIGEIVEIKGVKFRVNFMRRDGRLNLKMEKDFEYGYEATSLGLFRRP